MSSIKSEGNWRLNRDSIITMYIAFLAWWGPCVNFIDVSLMRAGWLWQLSRVTTSSHVTCPLTIITPCLIALLKSIRILRGICPSHKYHALCTGMNKIKNLLGPISSFKCSAVLFSFPSLRAAMWWFYSAILLQCYGAAVLWCCSVTVLYSYLCRVGGGGSGKGVIC